MFRAEPAVVSAHKTQPKHSSGKHVISATFCRSNDTSAIIRGRHCFFGDEKFKF